MQERIQQVSLSELMTSGSHFLPTPPSSSLLIWWDRGVMGGAHVSAREYIVEGWRFRFFFFLFFFFSGDGLRGGKGPLAPPWEEVI